MATKRIVKVGNFSVTTTGAQTFTPTETPEDYTAFNTMNVIFDVITISGTSPTTQPSFQEQFSSANSSGYIETANWGATITTTGRYMMCNQGQTGQTGTANIKYGYAAMGTGTKKQVVFTNGGTIGAISIDVYYVYIDSKNG